MSANNIGVLRKYKGNWYVFDETAEEVVGDRENGNKRYLEITDKLTQGPYKSLDEAYKKAEQESLIGEFEYGLHHVKELDGIKFVLTYKGKEVEDDSSIEDDTSDERLERLERRVENLESALETSNIIHQRLIKALQRAGIQIDQEYIKVSTINFKDFKDEKRIQALKELDQYIEGRRWKVDKEAIYLVADWFELQVMTTYDIDDELTPDKTTLRFLPLLTKRQAEKLLKDQKENLALILS